MTNNNKRSEDDAGHFVNSNFWVSIITNLLSLKNCESYFQGYADDNGMFTLRDLGSSHLLEFFSPN